MGDISDRLAALLLCADVEERKNDPSAPPRLTTAEWNALIRVVQGTTLEQPAALIAAGAADLAAHGVATSMAERIARLADRRSNLEAALDDLRERGIWVVTRLDEAYPAVLKSRLRERRPVILTGAGPIMKLGESGVAIVGARDVDERGSIFAADLGRALARRHVAVVSGGARGVDRLAMNAAVKAGGATVGVIADSLAKTVRARETHQLLEDGSITLVTPFSPWAPFSPGNAMGRNKFIYALSRAAVVVASTRGKGGTWAGAIENLENRWVPLWVRDGDDLPAGNVELIRRGGRPLRDPEAVDEVVLGEVVGPAPSSPTTLF